jgi:hypothetical protein
MKRILVGILYSEEREYTDCIASLSTQVGVFVEYFVISGKPNKPAHDDLYASFMSRASEFDYFFKLDADMTLRTPNSLKTLADTVVQRNAAHCLSYVWDVPSSLSIPGVQFFRSDSRWEGSDEQLNVDYPPRLTGESLLIIDPVVVDHMPSPSSYQLFRYGIHKAIKSIQHGRGSSKSIRKGLLHAAIINGIVRNYFMGRSDLIWALIGARSVFEDGAPAEGYHSEETKSKFILIESDPHIFNETSRMAKKYFSNEVQNLFRWINSFQRT